MRILPTFSCVLIGIAIGGSGFYALEKSKIPRAHKLQFPLALSGGTQDSPVSILPKGTSLYYDQAFPEGFVRYKIYINVEGVKLESQEVTEKFLIDPLTAFPFDNNSLQKPTLDHPLTKDDLTAILRSGTISKKEIQDPLTEFSH
ncbi:hypothetical protein ACNRBS_06510 [Ralstonia pseudosolanacearum]|uniref:hypothetical protein n=1 Tax=Ralstonia pseudosolanacearum TaxID=1310165 RepID=UPI000A65A2AB|nr:hypothetical protein [Ralstonia pseudosolanacearum]MCF1442832.1 hypothetical protein [Ralstonia solanacearum]BCL94787.1 hypothetical protein MAFF211479_44880 [Ralstonia solanacearum]BCL99884.1 hypothetical protein MAFF211491_43360 [Ralstonia solanacearum]BCM15380.1 hypothetical protein MAFF241648_45700 [Ralstonia solanacearum]BCN07354.1 hypothetical protein RPSB_44910 [Ralstonia solanacearum]